MRINMDTEIAETDAPSNNHSSNEVSEDPDYHKSIAVQANDYEIERSRYSRLPPRRRFVPQKFRDYHDPDEPHRDSEDEDYKPPNYLVIDEEHRDKELAHSPVKRPYKPSGRPRGRPRKIPKLEEGAEGDVVATVAESETDPGPEEEIDGSTASSICNTNNKVIFKERVLCQPRPFRCQESSCSQTFLSNNALKRHQSLAHNGDGASAARDDGEEGAAAEMAVEQDKTQMKKWPCSQCNQTFTLKGNLKTHTRIHTGEKPFKCEMEKCIRSFRSNEALKRHQLAHLGIKPFQCKECLQQFSSNVALREHVSRHTNSKPYKCHVCHKDFRQVSCYQRHLTIHTGETPYSCNVCHRKFSQSAYLKSHMKSHTGEKPYKCEICGKSFAHMSDRTRHKMVHTGVKPYVCEVCGTRFSDPSSCRRHIKEHAGLKMYSCTFCSEAFRRPGQLKGHVSKHHMGAPDGVVIGHKVPLGPVRFQQRSIDGDCRLNIENGDAETDASEAGGIPVITLVGENSAPSQINGGENEEVLTEETQRILEQIQAQMAAGRLGDLQAIGDDGNPLQVAYHVLHDDDHQQIVEIQYETLVATEASKVGVEMMPPTQEITPVKQEVAPPTAGKVADGTRIRFVSQNVTTSDATAPTSEAGESLLVLDAAQVVWSVGENGILSMKPPESESKSEVSAPLDNTTESVATDGSGGDNGEEELYTVHVEGEAEQHTISKADIHMDSHMDMDSAIDTGSSTVVQLVEQSMLLSDNCETVIEQTVEQSPAGDVSDGTQPVQNQTSLLTIPSQKIIQTIAATSPRKTEILSSTDFGIEVQDTTASSTVSDPKPMVPPYFLTYPTSTFVETPDFASQDYYNWLSEFTDECERLQIPLAPEVFKLINQVHKSLTDVLATPTGVLSNKDNFRILMNISKDLNRISNHHLMCVLANLESCDA